MSRRSKVVALTMLLGSVGGLVFAAPAAIAGQSKIPLLSVKGMRPHLDWAGNRTAARTAALAVQPAAATPIRDFTRTIVDGAQTFRYTMIGKNPFVAQTRPSTTIKTYIQPIVIHFSNGHTWDPTVADSCDSGASALQRSLDSPIFKPTAWSFGGTSVGKAQYVDAVQRAGFYEQTKPTGINPGYHVKLAPITLPKMTINVPVASSAEYIINCGNNRLAGIEINYWDNLVQSTLLPGMAAQGLTLKDLPLFLFGNVVMWQGTPNNCCILGYHFSKGSGATFQSYANSMYDTSGAFTGISDVHILAHELSEWQNDPNGVNLTKPWGHIGQVSGCQGNLETGDPLTGKSVVKSLNGKTYHPQELAFYSWFYHQNPSQGVNGWFSNNGTFLIDANPCT